MRLNENTALLSSKVLLVPYDPHHVPMYHLWMEDPHLRDATASEGLTIDEEYKMQQSWRTDNDKLTFISVLPPPEPEKEAVIAEVDDPPENMIGDINLFFFDNDSEDDEDTDGEEDEDDINEDDESAEEIDSPLRITGEVEIMIARRQNQGRGLGKATLLLFLAYVLRNREAVVADVCKTGKKGILSKLCVKIGQKNVRSIALFEGIGFRKRKEKTNYFGEYELYVDLGAHEYQEYIDKLLESNGMGGWQELKYERWNEIQALN
ncbi:GNAT domain-containing protein [Kalaharituber pfeilii]|nr:GNAT domain-containing protein [Kalaharituber pfeilii]